MHVFLFFFSGWFHLIFFWGDGEVAAIWRGVQQRFSNCSGVNNDKHQAPWSVRLGLHDGLFQGRVNFVQGMGQNWRHVSLNQFLGLIILIYFDIF